MEPMLGKLVNFDLDLDVTRPIRDNIAKKVFDRAQFMIERKGMRNVFASIPAVHLFACNQLPATTDVTKNVYQHRFLIFTTDSFSAPMNAGMDFDEFLWTKEGPAIVARFLAGLQRLITQKGHFTRPASSSQAITEMTARADLVSQFISDMEAGELLTSQNSLMSVGRGFEIEKPILWEIYAAWQEKAEPNNSAKLGKIKFFSRLASMGFGARASDGKRYVVGLGVHASHDGVG
jgi:phage/plasmid-associated DNA primase